MTVTVHPLTADRWPDLERLFGQPGCSMARGCWCMYYRESGKQHVPEGMTPPELRRQRAKALAHDGPPPGLLAYSDGDPVGWVALAPRSVYPKLKRSPVLKPVSTPSGPEASGDQAGHGADTEPSAVWSVVCFVVPSRLRHQGIARTLLRAAIEYAREQGAAILEAYPVDKAEPGSDSWIWNGAKSMFDREGFVEVVRRKPQRPVVQLRLESRSAETASVELSR